MEPRTNPSGGDWALEREGAVRLEGTEAVTISHCARPPPQAEAGAPDPSHKRGMFAISHCARPTLIGCSIRSCRAQKGGAMVVQ
eukprot:5250770-Prymnesium_polylepis.2